MRRRPALGLGFLGMTAAVAVAATVVVARPSSTSTAAAKPAAGTCSASGVTSRSAAHGAPTGTLTIADLHLIESSAPLWRAATCTHVTAIKAPGTTVWETFNADVRDADTSGYLHHDMIVVLAAYDVPQDDLGASVPYGSPAPLDKGKSVILDAVTGRVLEAGGFGTRGPDAHTPDPSALGTPTAVLAG